MAVTQGTYLARIQQTLKELVFLSEHDPLTKLYNRGAFERIISDIVHDQERLSYGG